MRRDEALIGSGDPMVITALRPLLTKRRLERIEAALVHRSYGITVVLEALYDQGNVAAVMRTCDGLGVQRVNLILTNPYYKTDRKVSQGSHKWLDVHRYHSAAECIGALRHEGYRILATHLADASPLSEVDFSPKTALVFGNEKMGVSQEVLGLADGCVKIPMLGFAQSFNVSVAAAISLYHATQDRERRTGRRGDLSEGEKQLLRERFFRRSVRRSELVIEELRR